MGLPPVPAVIDLSHGTLSLGTWIFWPAFVLALLALAAGGALLAAYLRGKDADTGAGAATLLVAGLVVAGAAAWVYWPLDSSYHRWYPVAGTVAAAPDSRLVKDGHGVSQRYAVRLLGSEQVFGCDDTRCSALTAGDPLYLLCKRQWQLRGVPGWVCVYNRP